MSSRPVFPWLFPDSAGCVCTVLYFSVISIYQYLIQFLIFLFILLGTIKQFLTLILLTVMNSTTMFLFLQIVSSASTDLQDYTYYFVPAPWLSCKLLRLLQCYPPPEDGAVKGRLVECLETILNKAQEPPKSKKVQHSNAKNAILFEAISLIIHYDR